MTWRQQNLLALLLHKAGEHMPDVEMARTYTRQTASRRITTLLAEVGPVRGDPWRCRQCQHVVRAARKPDRCVRCSGPYIEPRPTQAWMGYRVDGAELSSEGGAA